MLTSVVSLFIQLVTTFLSQSNAYHYQNNFGSRANDAFGIFSFCHSGQLPIEHRLNEERRGGGEFFLVHLRARLSVFSSCISSKYRTVGYRYGANLLH